MNDLVLKQNTVGVITLKEITDLITVEHNKAMKVVDRLCLESSFGEVEKFTTLNLNNVKVETYLLTKKQAIAVGAKLNNSLLMKVIDRLEELESQKVNPILTVSEKIALIAQGHQEVEQRLTEIEYKIENDITLTSAQKYHLKQLVSKKAYELKENHKLEDSFMSKVFARFYKKLKKHFIVSSYMEIPEVNFDDCCIIVNKTTLSDLL